MNWFETSWERYRKLDQRNPYISPGLATVVSLILLALDLRIEPTPESGFKQEGVLGIVLAVGQVLPLHSGGNRQNLAISLRWVRAGSVVTRLP